MGSATSLAIRLIDDKKLGTPMTNLDTSTSFQGVIKVNRVATRPDAREYLKELIVSSATNISPGNVVQSVLSGDVYIVASLDNIDANQSTAVRVALLYKANATSNILEFTPSSRDQWGQTTPPSFTSRLSGIYTSVFTKLPDEKQNTFGSSPDGIFLALIPKTVHTTYRPKRGDRIVTTDMSDGFSRTWQIDKVDPDQNGPNTYQLLLSEDTRS